MSVSPQHNAISPPTPAPSPQPELHALLPSLATNPQPRSSRSTTFNPSPLSTSSTSLTSPSQDAISLLLSSLPLGHSSEKDLAILLALMGRVYPSLSQPRLRHQFLSSLVSLCPLSDLTQLSTFIQPRLKLDFLTALPAEVGLNVLGWIDDPRTLARAEQVSSRWRSLVEDEGTWKGMCEKHKFEMEGGGEDDEEEDEGQAEVQGDIEMEQDESMEALVNNNNNIVTPQNPVQADGDEEMIPVVSTSSVPTVVPSIPDSKGKSRALDTPISSASTSQTVFQMNYEEKISLLESLKSRFEAHGLEPSNASKDLKQLFFISSLIGRKSKMDEQKAERMTIVELILREECEARFGGLGVGAGVGSTLIFGNEGIEIEPEMVSMDVDGGDSTLPAISSSSSKSKQSGVLGIGRPKPQNVANMRREASENLGSSGGVRTRSSSGGLNPSRRNFSYRTHFKLAYLTESNWLRGGRLLTQHTSSDNGAVVTSLALDSEWIVVGMANSKIHVFDAKTGLFASTLQGHESGVWCLTLVSKTERKDGKSNSNTSRSKSSSASTSATPSKAGSTKGDRNENDLKLVHHDTRQSATSTSSFNPQLAHPTPTYPVGVGRSSRLASDLTSKVNSGDPELNSSSSSKEKYKSSEEDEYQSDALIHWFTKARDLLAQKERDSKSSPNEARGTAPTEEHAKARAKGAAAALAEAEAGSIRDAIMKNGTDSIPNHLAHLSRPEVDDDSASSSAHASASISISISTSTSSSVPKGPTSFKDFGPFNAGAEGEFGAGGEPHLVGEDGVVEVEPTDQIQPPANPEITGNMGLNGTLKSQEEEEDDPMLKRPYSPSDYARAYGEELEDDEDPWSNPHSEGSSSSTQRNGNSESWKKKSKRSKPTSSSFANAGEDALHTLTGSAKGFGNQHALVISGACDRTVRVWDLRTGTCKHVLRGHTSTVRCLKVLDGRPLAISGSRDSTLRVWDIKRGVLVHLLAGHQHSVRCIEVSGTRVASGSYDCTCRVWDVLTGECLHVLRGHFHQIYAVAFDGKHVATGSLDSTVRVFDANTGKNIAILQGHTSLVGQLQLTNSILITGGSDGRVIIFCLKTFQCLHRLCAHDNSVTCLQFDEKFIVTGGNDGRVKLWNFKTGAFIREICEPSEQVWKVSYRDDKCVILCKREGKTSMDVITFRPPIEAT